MKTIRLALFVTAAALLTACSGDDAGAPQPAVQSAGRVPILISASPQTRAGQSILNTRFDVGDEFDVQITAQNGLTSYELLTYYTTDTDGALEPKGGVYPYYPTDKSAVDIRAVYPSGLMQAGSFAVQNPQVAKSAYKASDLMFAQLTDVATPDGEQTLVLDFKHKLSKIQVNLTGEGGVSLTGSTVTLLNVQTQTAFSPVTGAVTVAGAFGSVTDIKMSEDGEVGSACIIVPQSVPSGYLLEIVLKNNDILHYRTAQTTLFEPGKVYTYNIKVIESNISVSTTVEDWSYDPETDIQERTKLPQQS